MRHFSWIAACALVLSAAACSSDTTSVGGGPPALVGDTVTLASGLRYIDATVGSGATAHAGQSAAVHYSGWLANGTLFDTSLNGSPYVFTLGAGTVIQGWDQGIPGMRVGGKRRLIVPPSLGYGSAGAGSIPPNSTLIFDVELRALSGT